MFVIVEGVAYGLWPWILLGNVLGKETGKTETDAGIKSNQVNHLG